MTVPAQVMASLAILSMFALVAYNVQVSSAADPCEERRYIEDSIVCVCSESYCDTIDPIAPTPQGVVQIYESDRTYFKRLAKRNHQFGVIETPPIGEQIWNVRVDRSRTYHQIVGFGGAFSDAAVLTIGSLSENLQRKLYSSYFSETGIEYNMARVVISGCDFSTRAYTYDDHPDDWELERWSLVEEDTRYKIPQIKLAQEVAKYPIKLFASSWSPPAWMKTNEQLEGAGTLKEGPGSQTWETYARYLVKFFDSYKAAGVDFWGMTVQNEPNTGFSPGYPWMTCGFTAEMERDFVKMDLGPNLAAAGYTPDNFNVIILDHNRDIVVNWTDTILADPVSAAMVKGVGLHWYLNHAAPVAVYDQVHERYPNHFLLATEACVRHWNDVIGLGGWYMAEMYAHDIIQDLQHSVGGWVDWNLAVDMQGGPNYANNFHSAPIIVNAPAGEFYKNTQYYAMAHFTKFLPEGSRRIGITPEVSQDEIRMVVFQRPDNAMVVVIVNSYEENQFVILEDTERGSLYVDVGSRSFNTWVYY